jgi:hypothetical protein
MDEWGRVYMGEGVKKSRIQEFQASRADRRGLQKPLSSNWNTPELRAIQKAYDDERSGKIYEEAQAQNRTLKSIDSELKKRPSVTW